MKQHNRILFLALVMALVMVPTGALATDITMGWEIPPSYMYEGARNFSEGLAAVCMGKWPDGKWGYIDKSNKLVIPSQYDEVKDFQGGLAAVKLNDKWGFIDATGKEIVPCQYESYYNSVTKKTYVPTFFEGLAAVKLNDKWGFINATGKEVIPCKYDYAQNFSEGLAAVTSDGKWGFVDTTGQEVISFKYTTLYSNFSEGFATMGLDHEYYVVIDPFGKEIISIPNTGSMYSIPPIFCEGFAKVVEMQFKTYVQHGSYPIPVKAFSFIDTAGKKITPCKYDGAKDFSEGLAAVYLSGKGHGFIDTTGQEVIPCKYQSANSFYAGLAAVQLDDKWGYIDGTGTEVIPCKLEYDQVTDFHEGLAAVKSGNKWGFIDMTGREVIPCQYSAVTKSIHSESKYIPSFSNGVAIVADDWKWHCIDKTGKVLWTGLYDLDRNIPTFSEDYIAARDIQSSWWGFITSAETRSYSSGERTFSLEIPYQYDDVGNFSEGLAAVAADSGEDEFGDPLYKWGFIDQTGREVVPCQYNYPEHNHDFEKVYPEFSEGLAAVLDENHRWGFIDTSGREVLPFQYNRWGTIMANSTRDNYIPKFMNGVSVVYCSGGNQLNFGVIDKTGREVVPVSSKYVFYRGFSEGLVGALVQNTGIYGFIDTTGKEVIPCKYGNGRDFSEGLAAVKLNGKCGFIDKTGKEVIPRKYDWAGDFSEGLAAVQLDDKWGYIDKTGNLVISGLEKYSIFGSFSNGLAAVAIGDSYETARWGFIDRTGREVIPCIYEDINGGVREYGDDGFSESYAVVKLNGKWGYIDTTGKEVVPFIYANARNFHNGFAPVQLFYGGKWGFLTVSETDATAYASTQTVNVDGKAVTFECYALKDANGNATNYIKLRDLAVLLNGSAAQFQVGWDGSVTITAKTAYTPNGSELSTPYSGDRAYQETNAATKVNGQTANLAAFMLTDDKGGGYTYYQLRDLGKALGFNVGWSVDRGMFIETDKPYDPNN